MANRVETQIVPPDREVSPTWMEVLFAAVVYCTAVLAPFTFDDFAIFTAEPVTRPLTWLTFRLNGQHPAAFHAVNVGLHLLSVWLCRDTLRRILPARAAMFATLIFALHPIQSEAVHYVWARSTLLMTVFALLAMRDWLRGRHWWTAVWCALALGAKEEAVALPVFFALLHFSISRNAREWRPIGAMFAMSLAAGVYTLRMANSIAGSQAGAQALYTPLQYLASEGLAIVRYVSLVFVPWGQTVDHDLPAGWSLAWIPVLALAGFALRHFRQAAWGFWVLAALVFLLPTSSILPTNDLIAERRMYLPMVAIAAALGLWAQHRSQTTYKVVGLILLLLAAGRDRAWRDNTRLWTEAVENSPRKLRPRVQLARALPPTEAIPVLQSAKDIAPDDSGVASELGRTYLALNRPAEALQEFGRALALAPGSAEAMSNRGVALAMLKQDAAAKADFERALAADACSFEARLNLKRLGVPTPVPPNCRYTPEQRAALQ